MQNNTDKKRYTAIKHSFMIIDIIFSFLLLFGVLFTGISHTLRDYALSLSPSFYGSIAIYIVFIGLVLYVFSFPVDFYSGFILEHRFNLSNQSFFQWLKNNFKKNILSFVLFLILIEVMYFLMQKFPGSWWIWIASVWVIFSIVLGRIAPVLIVPLFYKYKDITNEELKQRILHLAQKTGVKVKDIFEIDMSKDTKKANAAVIGLGKSRRIILGDTLTKEFTIDEIETVIAHEMGHHCLNHMIKLLVYGALLTFVGFYLCYVSYGNFMATFGLKGSLDIAGLPLIGLIFFIFSIVIMPLQNMYSRFMEKQADLFALKYTANKESFISAMQKLSDMNLSDEEPNKIIEFLFYSHPSIKKRIEMAREIVDSR